MTIREEIKNIVGNIMLIDQPSIQPITDDILKVFEKLIDEKTIIHKENTSLFWIGYKEALNEVKESLNAKKQVC